MRSARTGDPHTDCGVHPDTYVPDAYGVDQDGVRAVCLRSGAGWLCALLTIALSVLTMRARAVDLDVLVGFGQSTTSGARYRPSCWTPVTVYLSGPGARGVGQLQISVSQGGRQTLYTRRVALSEGQLNQAENFAIQLHDADWYSVMNGGAAVEIDARLVLDGRSVAGPKKVALPTAVGLDTYNLLALTRDGSGFDFLGRKRLGLVHRGFDPAGITGQPGINGTPTEVGQKAEINPNATFQALYTDPRALPEFPQGYEMIDAIALADQPIDSLTRDQVDAIKGYVRMGGLLIVSGGSDTARLRSQFYQEMLPVVEPHAVLAHALPGLEQRYHTPLSLGAGTALAIGTLKPDAHTLLADAFGPLIVSRAYGCGRVVFTAFDCLDRSLRAWPGNVALWHDLLRCGNNAISARAVLAASPASMHGQTLQLADALAGVRASKAPPWTFLMIFCGAYLVLLVPVNYLVLKKLDRREWTWITAPILIVGFTFASYLFARSIKGGALSVNRAVVLETTANSDVVAGYGQMSLYSPERAAYDVGLGPHTLDNPCRLTVPSEIFMGAGQSLGQDLTIDTDQTGPTIRGALVRLWDKRSFDTPLLLSLGGSQPDRAGSVDAVTTALPDGKRVSVTVTNRTKYTLDHCALIGQDQTVSLGTLPPGATGSSTMVWNARRTTNNIQVTYDPDTSATEDPTTLSDSPAATQRRIGNALALALSNGSTESQGFGMASQDQRGFGNGVNAFIGWFRDPILDVRVNGQAASGEEVNLLLAHLPAPTNVASVALHTLDPFTTAAVTRFDDQTSPGMQGIFR
jgi:hypothetical protein